MDREHTNDDVAGKVNKSLDSRDEITSLVTMLIGYVGGIVTAETLRLSHEWVACLCAVATSMLAATWCVWRKRK